MTDRLDEIRKRLAIPGHYSDDARHAIAYLIEEVDNLTHDIGKALESLTLEIGARTAAEAELRKVEENGHKTWTTAQDTDT